MTVGNFRGFLVPALTPFKDDLSVDTALFIQHCQWLLDQGADGLAVFGTTSEANSLSTDEKAELLEALIDGGIPAAKLMPGTGCCALTDSVRLTKLAVEKKCGGVLMLPPFYYKGMSDQGLFNSYSEVIQRVGSSDLNIYLYHIPPQTGVPITLNLIEMLLKEYAGTVVGIKDSSGDWNNTQAMLDQFPEFDVFPGSEVFLLQGLRAGGQGCITATGNVNPSEIKAVYNNWETDKADALQDRINTVRMTIQPYGAVPSQKRLFAEAHGNPGWKNVRPPMVAFSDEKYAELKKELEAINFAVAAK